MERDAWFVSLGDNGSPRQFKVSVANEEIGFEAFDFVLGHRRRRKRDMFKVLMLRDHPELAFITFECHVNQSRFKRRAEFSHKTSAGYHLLINTALDFGRISPSAMRSIQVWITFT